MSAHAILRTWPHALGGVVVGGQVLRPGPGHSPGDRSLSVTISANSDGIVVYSHAGDDWRICRDHVRARLPATEPRSVCDARPLRAASTAPYVRLTATSKSEFCSRWCGSVASDFGQFGKLAPRERRGDSNAVEMPEPCSRRGRGQS
jgi:hypothetical protein